MDVGYFHGNMGKIRFFTHLEAFESTIFGVLLGHYWESKKTFHRLASGVGLVMKKTLANEKNVKYEK